METEGSDRFADNVRNIFDYCLNQAYPEGLSRDQKKEFRRKCRNFTIEDGALLYIGHKEGMYLFFQICIMIRQLALKKKTSTNDISNNALKYLKPI